MRGNGLARRLGGQGEADTRGEPDAAAGGGGLSWGRGGEQGEEVEGVEGRVWPAQGPSSRGQWGAIEGCSGGAAELEWHFPSLLDAAWRMGGGVRGEVSGEAPAAP